MLEIIFTIDGIEQKQMAIIECQEELDYLLENYKEDVLEQYPTATNIQLGQLYTSIGLRAD
jgi:hypothetical protein